MSHSIESALWLYLNDRKLDSGFSGQDFLRVLESFESLQGVRESEPQYIPKILSDERSIEFAKSLRNKLVHATDANLAKYVDEIDRLRDKDIDVLCFSQNGYPPKLRLIPDPPLVIFRKGKFKEFSHGHYVAIVGTRRSSHRAHYFARELARELAARRYIVVSGLARGIDTEAHCGSLDVGGTTIAVLPRSIERIYPVENEELAVDIAERGALLSETSSVEDIREEFAPYRFVERNRITSGLSEAVVIVESGPTGGSIRQFDFAKAQGRKVFVPQPIDRLRAAYKGYETLLKQGASPLHSTQDIINYIEGKQNSSSAADTSLDRFSGYRDL